MIDCFKQLSFFMHKQKVFPCQAGLAHLKNIYVQPLFDMLGALSSFANRPMVLAKGYWFETKKKF
jgi:hypothetical protein